MVINDDVRKLNKIQNRHEKKDVEEPTNSNNKRIYVTNEPQ